MSLTGRGSQTLSGEDRVLQKLKEPWTVVNWKRVLVKSALSFLFYNRDRGGSGRPRETCPVHRASKATDLSSDCMSKGVREAGKTMLSEG